VLEQLAARVSPRVLAAPRKLDQPRRELDQYFAGRRRHFEIPQDWQLIRGFARRVLDATARVPYGSTSTYKQMATAAGSPRASRAAGNALGSNPLPIVVPCHRILHATGGLGGYTGGLEKKRLLLAVESGQSELAAP
jgi:methylated-DNA-[protein]-cysteine S-methyltransferase